MTSLLGKRLVLGIVAVVCASAVTVLRGYDAQSYVTIMLGIFGLFAAVQTITDSIGK